MTATNFAAYFNHYIKQVDTQEPVRALEETQAEFLRLLAKVDDEKGLYQYEDDKWSIKEVVSHVIDAERVFASRAMSFARNDKTELAGFDDHLYAQNSGANNRSMDKLLAEFEAVRQASMALFNSFDEEMWQRIGTANSITIDIKSIAYLIAGHCRHHGKILQERYGV
jgi:hypothetical protein